MTKPRMCVLVAAFLILCAAAGCGSSAETFLAVDVPEIGGPNGLTAKAGVADYSLATVSLPVDILPDAPDDIFLALRAEGITVVVDSEAAARPNPSAKAQEYRASVTFLLAEPDLDACGAPGEVGPFALTITDDLVTLDRESVALDSRAQLLVRGGRFEVCTETRADFDGSIALGAVSFEFGRLRSGEERVVLCHIPPGDPADAYTITVGSSAVAAHLAHGDYLGECQAGDDYGDAPDSDGDGVSDDADQCAATPADEVADEAGCSCSQRDGDADGVDDCSDACPNSATGAAVDGTGCAAVDLADDDGDGVSNGTDDCPGTSEGVEVDQAGCSCAQRDGDADGVNDCDDACPNIELVGWGDNASGQINVPSDTFVAAAGFYHGLAIRSDGTLVGWGKNDYGEINVPTGTFTAVAAGENHSLAIRSDGTLVGWGYNGNGEINVPTGTFTAVAAGFRHSLAIRTDGTLAGWGSNAQGQINVPTGTFTVVDAGEFHSLAIRSDGTLAGWGYNGYGQIDVPAGTFTTLAAGFHHSLAIRSDGTLIGWGRNERGQINVPTGTFTAVAAGAFHSLAIRSDGTLAGWGSNDEGQINVPAGTFTGVAAGNLHSLAIASGCISLPGGAIE